LPSNELVFKTAVELARLVRQREASCVEVMRAHLEQIKRVNPKVNAVCTLVAEQALAQAKAADKALKGGTASLTQTPSTSSFDTLRTASGRRLSQRERAGKAPLFGLPVGVKDLHVTAGIRTTFGSRIYRDFVPGEDALIVQRYKAGGAIVIGKTNTPEFGAGSHTFNEVFGKTLNPYDLTKTCGGSSGGSAVGLACGMFPLATGSDLGGSLRNPAAWNNVVGMRPSIGRVPRRPNALGWNSLSVDGPMGRSVADVALQMSVIAGPDAAAPVAFGDDPAVFAGMLEWDAKAGRPAGAQLAAPFPRAREGARLAEGTGRSKLRPYERPTRVAWSRDLGRYPIDPAVTRVVERQRATFEKLGCEVEDASPDLSDADEIFQVYRAYAYAQQHERHLREHKDLMKQTVIWNTEQGLKLSALDMARAEEKRTRLYEHAVRFFEEYDFLVLPATSVPPFPVEQEYVTEINGVKLKTYIDWFAICYAVSVTGFPAISAPAGFTGTVDAQRPSPIPSPQGRGRTGASLLRPDLNRDQDSDPPSSKGRGQKSELGLPVGLQIVGGPGQDWPVLQIAHAYEQATRFGERRPALAV
jgi:amidase